MKKRKKKEVGAPRPRHLSSFSLLVLSSSFLSLSLSLSLPLLRCAATATVKKKKKKENVVVVDVNKKICKAHRESKLQTQNTTPLKKNPSAAHQQKGRGEKRKSSASLFFLFLFSLLFSLQRMLSNLALIASITAPRSSLTATGGLAREHFIPSISLEW